MGELPSIFPAETASQEETRSLGASFGETLRGPGVVALFGDLGSGKTQFVKGICRYFEIEESSVSSPTFTIVNEYEGALPIYHMDLYRVKTLEEALDLGLMEYLESKGICLIEWPELIEEILPLRTVGIHFRHIEGDVRSVRLIPSTSGEERKTDVHS